jgi:hypothetical protein
MRESTRLPRELDRVLVRVGAGHGKKYTTILETSLLEQGFGEFGTGLGPQAEVTKHKRSACSRIALTTLGC